MSLFHDAEAKYDYLSQNSTYGLASSFCMQSYVKTAYIYF